MVFPEWEEEFPDVPKCPSCEEYCIMGEGFRIWGTDGPGPADCFQFKSLPRSSFSTSKSVAVCMAVSIRIHDSCLSLAPRTGSTDVLY